MEDMTDHRMAIEASKLHLLRLRDVLEASRARITVTERLLKDSERLLAEMHGTGETAAARHASARAEVQRKA